ncbi:MAG: hypothetical protein ACP5K2_04740 [bacterium]
MCSFCPYYKVLYKKDLAKRFKDALLNEIDIVSALYKDKIINSVYFGGGTPALLIEYLLEIVTKLKSSFDIRGDFAIELHPLDISKAALSNLKQIGFEMISIGV